MKVLVLGSTGMLGSAFVKSSFNNKLLNYHFTVRSNKQLNTFKKNFKINKNKIYILDIIDNDVISKLNNLQKKKFDIIINCIGVIKPYINESNYKSIENTLKINSLFPHFLPSVFNKNEKIYQIATDCVYNGKNSFYTEDSYHDAEDVYGKSKSLGEVFKKNFFNIRCSIIGEELKSNLSLVEWFKSQETNSNINGFANHQWNGLTTNAFVKLIESIIINKIEIPNIMHLVPKNYLTKYDLLSCLIKKFNRTDLNLNKTNHSQSINRTINTNNKKLNNQIWNKSSFKKKLTIEKMIELSL